MNTVYSMDVFILDVLLQLCYDGNADVAGFSYSVHFDNLCSA